MNSPRVAAFLESLKENIADQGFVEGFLGEDETSAEDDKDFDEDENTRAKSLIDDIIEEPEREG